MQSAFRSEKKKNPGKYKSFFFFFSNFLHTLGAQTIKKNPVSSGDKYIQILMTPGLPQAMIYKKWVICGLVPMRILLGEIHGSLLFIHSYHPALGQENNNKQKHYNIRVPEQTSSTRKRHAR